MPEVRQIRRLSHQCVAAARHENDQYLRRQLAACAVQLATLAEVIEVRRKEKIRLTATQSDGSGAS